MTRVVAETADQVEGLRRAVRYILSAERVSQKARQLNLTQDQKSQLCERTNTEGGAAEAALVKLYADAKRPTKWTTRGPPNHLIDYSFTIAKARTGEPEPPLNFRGTPKNWNSPLSSNSSRFTSHSQWLMPSLRHSRCCENTLSVGRSVDGPSTPCMREPRSYIHCVASTVSCGFFHTEFERWVGAFMESRA